MEREKLNNEITALYCRLSKEDKQNGESMSIGTQKEMLMDYAGKNGFKNCKYYVDDGYSGTNSDREAFQEMLDDIRDGKVAIVITKDQSRLGRNYIETGTYMEIFFPEHGVRYIAINDGYDSDCHPADYKLPLPSDCLGLNVGADTVPLKVTGSFPSYSGNQKRSQTHVTVNGSI